MTVCSAMCGIGAGNARRDRDARWTVKYTKARMAHRALISRSRPSVTKITPASNAGIA